MLLNYILLLIFSLEGLGQDCPVRNEALLENGRSCRKSCQSDSECKGKLKSCNCDDVCGRSCFNPSALCKAPEQIENGEINGQSFTYGSIITYTCSDGFVINGTATRRCRSDRKWSGLPPLCQDGCRSPTFERNSYSNSRKDNYNTGETLQYSCRPGYRLTGDEIRTCRGNGEWSPIRFDCIRRSCSVPPEPDNGYTEGEDYVFGSRVVYHCSRGHELTKSQNYITCGLANGYPDWITQDRNGEFPQCKRVECPAPINPDNGEVEIIGDKTFGAVIRYSCNSGFTIEGNVIARCNENRSWGEIPSCVADQWGSWDSWNSCSVTCDEGTQKRRRRCRNRNGAESEYCLGSDVDSRPCNRVSCKRDNWRPWNSWTSCSVTCGEGTQQRRRICRWRNYGSVYCPGSDVDIRPCNRDICERVEHDCDFENSARPLCSYNTEYTRSRWQRFFTSNLHDGSRGHALQAYLPSWYQSIETALTSSTISTLINRQQICVHFFYKLIHLMEASNFQLYKTTQPNGRRVSVWSPQIRDIKRTWLNASVIINQARPIVMQFVARNSRTLNTHIQIDDITVSNNCENHCSSLPCHNGGKCVNRIDTFECFCKSGYHGRLCSNVFRCTIPTSSPLHSSISPRVTTVQYGDHITVSCDDGYYISDVRQGTKSRVLTCGERNTWLPRMPRRCERQTLCADNGRPCVFPFQYGRQTFNECQYSYDLVKWCATTYNFNRDRERGRCIVCPNEWDLWSSWTSCSVTCGEGLRERRRRCRSNYGAGTVYCPGSYVDIEPCYRDVCEPEVDRCDANPCNNGGSCFVTGGATYCVCGKGYNGNNCENKL